MDYDLTRLGSGEFEHLVQALAIKHLGAGVEVFGVGPDGGREATLVGAVSWRSGEGAERWDGYAVVQAKFRQRPDSMLRQADWFIGQVNAEMRHWADVDSGRRKSGRVPEYLLWATNVVLSPAAGGGLDRTNAAVAARATELGLRGWQIWHYDRLCRLLDGAADVRTAFSGLITPGDVLQQIHDVLIGQPAALGQELSGHAAKDLLAERVRLGEASPDNEKFTLDQVAIDLPSYQPSTARQSEQPTVANIVRHGDAVLRPSRRLDRSPHRVIIGGPGQGKTTLGQLLAQTYRVALLEQDDTVGQEAGAAIAATRAALDTLGIPTPRNKRWPFRIDLAEYGDAVAGGTEVSIIRWISSKISERGYADVKPNRLHPWLGTWPWLLVLDGLDEVAALAAREHVLRHISDLLVDAAQVDADLLIVATTRPQGYEDEFAPRGFTTLQLAQLAPDRAITYARRLADVRHRGDPDGHRIDLERVAEAAADPLTARLMRTPLQVTIMSILLERRPRPPRDRHGLFEAFFETIYARESNKPGPLAKLLGDHRADVNALHEQVGLRLQVLAETAGDAEPPFQETSSSWSPATVCSARGTTRRRQASSRPTW